MAEVGALGTTPRRTSCSRNKSYPTVQIVRFDHINQVAFAISELMTHARGAPVVHTAEREKVE
jgi:hypothetical protein